MASTIANTQQFADAVDYAHELKSIRPVGDIATSVGLTSTFMEEVGAPVGFNLPSVLSTIKLNKIGDNFGCNLKPSDFIDPSTFAQTIYVDADLASSGSGNSWAFAYKKLLDAVDRAVADGISTRILVKAGTFLRGVNISGFNVTKNLTAPLSIEAVNGRVRNITADSQTWATNATYPTVYETARSTTTSVINVNSLTKRGQPKKYKLVGSITECAAESGTYYTDNVTVYVHAENDAVVTNENALCILNAKGASIITAHNLYIRGLDFYGGADGGLSILGHEGATIVVDDIRAMFAAGYAGGEITWQNGVTIRGTDLFVAFNSEASFNSKDGFNLTLNGTSIPAFLTVNCSGYANGEGFEGSVSCNGLTGHLGVVGIDVGGEYLESYGCNVAFVNPDTQVWAYGTKAGDSAGDKIHGGGQDYGAFGAWNDATGYFEHCTDVGTEIGLFSNLDDTSESFFRNHSGTGLKVVATEFTR